MVFWVEFVEALEERIQFYLTVNRSIYRDKDLRSKPGIPYPQELSTQLCESVCMIAVLVPDYQESSWCKAEWKAMEELEQQRLDKPERRELIIPVLVPILVALISVWAGDRYGFKRAKRLKSFEMRAEWYRSVIRQLSRFDTELAAIITDIQTKQLSDPAGLWTKRMPGLLEDLFLL